MPTNPTRIQAGIRKLKEFYREQKRMPSYREIAELMEYKSKFAAQRLIATLLEMKAVIKDHTGRLLPGNAFQALRQLGTVKAGWPSPAEEENVDTLSLDDWLIQNKEASFMLKVDGDSMIDAGIVPGDHVIIQRGRQPRNGDIVIAEVDNEWTMKYYEKQGQVITLMPANKNYGPIHAKTELKIAGVVTSVIRKLY